MSRCHILLTSRPMHPHLAHSPMEAVARCHTHDMPMDGLISANDLCPIGKIEEATEIALEKIAIAMRRVRME